MIILWWQDRVTVNISEFSRAHFTCPKVLHIKMLASIFYGNTAIVRNRKISQNKHSYSAHTSRQVSILGVVRGKAMHPFCRCVAIGAIKIISQVTNSGSGPYLSLGGGEIDLQYSYDSPSFATGSPLSLCPPPLYTLLYPLLVTSDFPSLRS